MGLELRLFNGKFPVKIPLEENDFAHFSPTTHGIMISAMFFSNKTISALLRHLLWIIIVLESHWINVELQNLMLSEWFNYANQVEVFEDY